jgi:hypothetical protein
MVAAMTGKSLRPPFEPRAFRLVNYDVVLSVIAAVRSVPLDPLRPLQVVIREEPKKRKLDQNSAYWAGPLRDIAHQAFIAGRQYSPDVLHHYFKQQFLPEQHDPALTLEGYEKWSFDPAGNLVLVGSTTQLTPRGFSEFLEQVFAFGASLGVRFSAPTGEGA